MVRAVSGVRLAGRCAGSHGNLYACHWYEKLAASGQDQTGDIWM